ncbi:MAG: ATP-binding protein [Synergistaceae bacterium]|jgi:predicted AAA+ superfamily ATPase|nr:ATP-binding protein [Synergistaceae bacterium]
MISSKLANFEELKYICVMLIDDKSFIKRHYQDLSRQIWRNRALILLGPRRAGKTTLLTNYLKTLPEGSYFLGDGGEFSLQEIFSSRSLTKMRQSLPAGVKTLALDEAQQIPHIGESIKLLVDHESDLQIILTGSASFALAGQIGEPLVGRQITLSILPVAQMELAQNLTPIALRERLPDFLVYGAYPEVLTTPDLSGKKRILQELVNSYLLKDILEFERVKNSRVIFRLLQLLAFQVSGQVSLRELSNNLDLDYKTVDRYLDLLEKCFIVKRLGGFSRNLRKEIHKKAKYFFFDNGVMNAVTANFNDLSLRADVGQLWENWLMMERFKRRMLLGEYANEYFWRTWDGQEVDLVEERDGKLYGFEFKYQKKARPVAAWLEAYPGQASWTLVNRDNYLDFLGVTADAKGDQ